MSFMAENPKRALLVIDVQNEYFTGKLPITYPTGSLANVLSAMDAASARRAERNVTAGAAFAAFHADRHALAVNVADLQERHFGAPHTRAVEGHQQRALRKVPGGIDEPRDLVWSKKSNGLERRGLQPRLVSSDCLLHRLDRPTIQLLLNSINQEAQNG